MPDEQSTDIPPLSDLRARLNNGLARARLNQTQLAGRAGLGRTTVSQALSSKAPVPSAETVAALAAVLELPVDELLELRRAAAKGAGTATADGVRPGRPIGRWEAHELEVHPAGPGRAALGPDAPAVRALPGYVPREHDRELAAAVRDVMAGRSRIVVLVGTSSTGKTRACWEAVQPLAEMGWWLWHPFDPTRVEAALEELCRVGPRTVVWLNEAQHYLGNPASGERIAAAVHRLLVDEERGPVLVLGTLWPEYARQYTALPTPGEGDPYSRVRELLSGRTQAVPDAFDTAALAAATALAEGGDRLLADALTRAGPDGRVTQDLAGAPELQRRYEQATPAARALLEAAMDARRLGVGLHLPQEFLTDAAPDYLSQSDYDQLSDDWAERAYAELAQLVHGKQAPLHRTTPRHPPTFSADATAPQPVGPLFQLADYLEQHGRTSRRHLCPPATFWHAAHTHLTSPDDLNNLAQAAKDRCRLRWAHHLQHRAADHGDTYALVGLAQMREKAGDRKGAKALYRQAADHGDTYALHRLAQMREEVGDRKGAEALARQAANHGNPFPLHHLAQTRMVTGERESAEALYQQAADHGSPAALVGLAQLRELAGKRESAEALARQAANHGNTKALVVLAKLRELAGKRESAEALARQAVDHGDAEALVGLALMREMAGDREGAEILYQQAVDHGNTEALVVPAELRVAGGKRESAEALYRRAADHGNPYALYRLAEWRKEAGERESAEALYQQAADHGSPAALVGLAQMREEAGERESAEALYRQAADHGDTEALYRLDGMPKVFSRLWPYGLEPGGTPTPPWKPSVSALLSRCAPPEMS
ncbi:helix-turn-helix domain-containing protein [Streptomyces sp. HNM0663]|uniref:Helix-turn-helix domain-containing protein n=1 Tax=Streptomyces chengmaiensis TaxID=3040919 RepID=A0ABT6HI39_9ACTN|nr:helix-turn-helix domain-containing protein [Streptomyces chengmaiensis]MDH2388424.1 helix-turn-helix domain-containing protein [Streptomyces chengmaiensis]